MRQLERRSDNELIMLAARALRHARPYPQSKPTALVRQAVKSVRRSAHVGCSTGKENP